MDMRLKQHTIKSVSLWTVQAGTELTNVRCTTMHLHSTPKTRSETLENKQHILGLFWFSMLVQWVSLLYWHYTNGCTVIHCNKKTSHQRYFEVFFIWLIWLIWSLLPKSVLKRDFKRVLPEWTKGFSQKDSQNNYFYSYRKLNKIFNLHKQMWIQQHCDITVV